MAAATKIQHGRLQAMAENLGFDIVYPNADEPTSSRKTAKFEIVAIPGLGSKAEEWSWNYDNVNWLRDTNMLARRIPQARISIFQYSREWFEDGTVGQRLDRMANRFLYGLDRIRGSNDTNTPIIFVCHSVGGIFLEKALLLARARQKEFPTVYPFVVGSIFLGTPFNGTSKPRAQVLADMAQDIGMGASSSDIVNFLAKESGTLASLLDEFALLARDIQMRLYCFFEQKESNRVKLPMKVPYRRQEHIVDEQSARITSADRLGLPVDHFGLNKFAGSKDPNFTTVAEEIRFATREADHILRSRKKEQIQALVDERTYRSMLSHLAKGFQDLESSISGQFKGSQGSKLLEQPAFEDWKQQDTSRLLWVHGKAGTGQGAVASSAIESLKTARTDKSVVTSFYCDQSEQSRRSLLGLLRMIIYQVIDTNRDFAVHLLSDSKKGKDAGQQDFDAESTLKVQVLWDALLSMSKDLRSGSIYVVIYGLEQLSPDALDDFLSYIRELLDVTPLTHENFEIRPIKWLVLSRAGRPNIENTLKSRALEIDLEDKENAALVSTDLRVQISVSVDTLGLPSSLAYFVKRHIHSRAEDNEIYVKLVIQELRNTWLPGKTQHAEIRRLLESFHYGFTNMFEHIRNRVLHPHAEGLEYTKEILRCLICAQVSPTMRDLSIMAGIPKDDRGDADKLKIYIVRCGAFLTLRGDEWDLENTTVEWINISAQDHLQQYAKKMLNLGLQDMQHGIIALRSLEYIYEVLDNQPDCGDREQADEDMDVQDEAPNADDNATDDAGSNASNSHDESDDNEPDCPDKNASNRGTASNAGSGLGASISTEQNAKYPIRYWVEHAKLAPQDVLDEFDLEHLFWQEESPIRQKWWKLIPDVHKHHDQDAVSALHLAVILKFPALVEYLLDHGRANDTHKDDSLGFQPLYYACEGGDNEIVDALLGANADINYTSDITQPAALYAASINRHHAIVKTLLDRDANLNAASQDYGTALYAAVSNHDHEIVALLLSRGAKVNVIGGVAQRALNIGALVGNLEGVRLLIDHGADVDPDEDYWYGSALGGASRGGHVDVVEYLLSRGWSPSRTMKTYGSFLTAAATYRHLDVVEALLKKEERVSELDRALQAAAQRGYVPIVKAILAKKPTLRLHAAFSSAAYHGRSEVLQILFERDLNGELQDDYQARDKALYQATDNEHEDTVRLLLEHNANPNAEGPTYGFALAASAYDGTIGIMQALIAKGADVNKRGGTYGTALQGRRTEAQIRAAAFRGDAENVKFLLDHGALLNTEPIGHYGNELQAAVYTGDEDTIRLLIDRGADVNAFGGHYSYAIITAVSQGYSTSTRILLENNAHVNVRGGEDNWPVISLAASTLLEADLKLILKNVADINATCDKGTTALINCAEAGDSDGLEFLLSNDADVHIISSSIGSALHAAAAIGNRACCEVLLGAGADVNAIGGEYGTAVQAAAWAEDVDAVRLLLDAGADITSETTISGYYGTALQAAAAVGSIEIVQELLDRGAMVNLGLAHGTFGCALSAAVVRPSHDVAELLLAHQADVNFQGGYHHLPIMAAAQSGDVSVLKLLLDHGADASRQGGMWGTVVSAAAYGESKECIEMLVEHGAEVRATGGHYGSALQAAVVRAEMDVIEFILDRAINLVNYRDGKYHTALIAAAYFDRSEVVAKLLDSGADFRFQGGRFRSVITAAAIKGNKAILEKFLKMGPPDYLLDEALVEACAHRQSSSVDALLKSGANINTRHPTLGSPVDALEAPEIAEENSDDEEDLDDDEEEEEEEDENEENDDSGSEEQWEGDNGLVSGEIDEGSVTDLQLEEELTEEVKIHKLLEEAQARCKRNPTVKRFRTVKHRGLPQFLNVGPPPPSVPRLPPAVSYEPYQPPPTHHNYVSQYEQHSQEPLGPAYNSGLGHQQPDAPYTQSNYATASNAGYTAYPAPLVAKKQVQSPSEFSQRGQSPQNLQQGQYPFPPSQPERQYSASSASTVPRSFTPPSRKGSEDHGLKRQSKAVNRKSIANLGLVGRYQQRQPSHPSPQGSTDRSIGHPDFAGVNQPAAPPTAPYSLYATQQQYPPQLQPRQSQQFNQPPQSQQSNEPQHSPYQTPPLQYPSYTSPPIQGPGYGPYSQASQMSSPATSVQSSQYANSTPYSSQSFTWDTPTSSQASGFRSPEEAQAKRWGNGGYDGEGYGR